MSNVFDNYFTSIAKKKNSTINFLPKHYTDYVSYTNTNTFFLMPEMYSGGTWCSLVPNQRFIVAYLRH